MTNLDSILKSRDTTLPPKVCLVKAMVFPVVMYGCQSWTIKKAAKSLQSCPTLWDPMEGSPPGSPTPGILQARTLAAAAAAKSLQSCPTLCDPIDGSPTGSSVIGILQALTRWTFLSKVMSLLFNMLSSLVITFLPRSKNLKFMAAVTICSAIYLL